MKNALCKKIQDLGMKIGFKPVGESVQVFFASHSGNHCDTVFVHTL
jgi:hypothetical protein